MEKPKYDIEVIRDYLDRRVSTSVQLADQSYRKWTSFGELLDHLGVSRRTGERWFYEGLPDQWRYAIPTSEFLGVEPYDLLMPSSREAYRTLLIDFRELRRSGESVADRNLETVRLSREILRWENFFRNGVFDVSDDEDETSEERARQREVDLDLDKLGLGQ